jgi:signal transduction histidine kinase
MSHELKTLLNPILGFAQLLQRDKKAPLPPRHKARVDHILRSGEHLLRLVGDALDLSRIEAGRISISIEPVRAHEVMEELRRTLDSLACARGVRIQLETPSVALPLVAADRTRLTQILLNFGSNAIKYSQLDGGTVTLAASVIRPGYVRLTVADNGLGIPRDKQEKIFQPFQRSGQQVGPVEGAGLGLAIAKCLAELMHGSTGFRSIEAEGSEFWVEVPVVGMAPKPRTA